MITKEEEEIQSYLQKIKRGEYPRPCEQCPRCKEKVGEYKLHDLRDRKFRIIVEAMVKIIIAILVRWKCPLCKKTFTVYPDFAVPYKQYTAGQIVKLSEHYLQGKEVSYENSPKEGRLRISYPSAIVESEIGAEGHESFLAGTTVRHWVCWLGSLKDELAKALELIKQKCPQTEIFRDVLPVFGRKYRSQGQKSILETALRVIKVRKEYERIFSMKFFPQFALRQ